MIRVAILGAGWAGTRHVEAIRELNGTLAVQGLADSDAAFLRQKAGELGVIRTWGSWEEAVADSEIDAVSICLPHRLHAVAAVAALEAGKHVLCEKPIAMTLAEARDMRAAARRTGRKLYVAENLVYTPMTRRLAEIVRTGEHVGEVVAASVVTGFRSERYGYPGRRAWLATPAEGGSGHWLLNGIHTVAQVRAIFGEIVGVYAREHHSSRVDRTDVEATLHLLLTTERGFCVSLLQSREVFLRGGLKTITLYGDRGTVRAGDEGYEAFGAAGRDGVERLYPVSALSDYALEMEAFAEYVTKDKEGPTSALSESRSLAVVLAGYASAASGKAVVPEDVD